MDRAPALQQRNERLAELMAALHEIAAEMYQRMLAITKKLGPTDQN